MNLHMEGEYFVALEDSGHRQVDSMGNGKQVT